MTHPTSDLTPDQNMFIKHGQAATDNDSVRNPAMRWQSIVAHSTSAASPPEMLPVQVTIKRTLSAWLTIPAALPCLALIELDSSQ